MSARPDSHRSALPTQRVLYRIDVDGVPSSLADAPPPFGETPLEGAAPVAATRSDGSPLFRIDHPLYDPDQRAGWLAEQLIAPGAIFHGHVHVAGAKASKSSRTSSTAQLTSATFTSIITQMLHRSSSVQQVCLPDELIEQAIAEGPHSVAHEKVEQGGQLLARLFLHYWRAVATAFADAWDDPTGHLLWHQHGLTAFARLGATVIEDHVAAYDIRQHYFDEALERIASGVSLARVDYEHVPQRELSDHLFQQLAAARQARGLRRGSLVAVPGSLADIPWGSAPAPRSPDVGSVPLGPEN